MYQRTFVDDFSDCCVGKKNVDKLHENIILF